MRRLEPQPQRSIEGSVESDAQALEILDRVWRGFDDAPDCRLVA